MSEAISASAYGLGPDEFGDMAAAAPGGPSESSGVDSSPVSPVADSTEPQQVDLVDSILTAPPVPEIPLPENSSSRLARRRSAKDQARRRGRASTILTSLDPLGG